MLKISKNHQGNAKSGITRSSRSLTLGKFQKWLKKSVTGKGQSLISKRFSNIAAIASNIEVFKIILNLLSLWSLGKCSSISARNLCPKDHKLRRIFNRNTIKISYSCMDNAKQIIDNHNKRILTASTQADSTAAAAAATATINNNKTCNCRQKNACHARLTKTAYNLQ